MKQIKLLLSLYFAMQFLSLDAMERVPEEEETKFPLSHTSSIASSSIASSAGAVSDPALMTPRDSSAKPSPARQRRRSQFEEEIAPDALYATVLHLIDNISQYQTEFDQDGMKKRAAGYFEARNLVELKKLVTHF